MCKEVTCLMKTKVGSIFLLFTIVAGIIAMSPASFADHHEVTITPVSGSGSGPGCELTDKDVSVQIL